MDINWFLSDLPYLDVFLIIISITHKFKLDEIYFINKKLNNKIEYIIKGLVCNDD